MMLLVLGVTLAVLALLTLALLGVWVYRDAKARGLDAWVWTLVALLTSGVGMLLYLLVGRREAQKTCPKCGKRIPAACAYCGWCGAEIPPSPPPPPGLSHKGLLAALIACAVLTAAVGVGLPLGLAVWSGGGDWTPSVSTVYVSNSWGDKWDVSWHYTNKTSAHSFQIGENGPFTLYFEGSSGEGPLILRVWQDNTARTFDLSGEGMSGSLDLSIFTPGRVFMELDNNKGEGKNVHFTSYWE